MTIAILGLGSRGLQVYGDIIRKYDSIMEVTAVADLLPDRLANAKIFWSERMMHASQAQKSFCPENVWQMLFLSARKTEIMFLRQRQR